MRACVRNYVLIDRSKPIRRASSACFVSCSRASCRALALAGAAQLAMAPEHVAPRPAGESLSAPGSQPSVAGSVGAPEAGSAPVAGASHMQFLFSFEKRGRGEEEPSLSSFQALLSAARDKDLPVLLERLCLAGACGERLASKHGRTRALRAHAPPLHAAPTRLRHALARHAGHAGGAGGSAAQQDEGGAEGAQAVCTFPHAPSRAAPLLSPPSSCALHTTSSAAASPHTRASSPAARARRCWGA